MGNAGYGGLEEMKCWLAEDRVLFGVLRLSFGCSARQRSAPNLRQGRIDGCGSVPCITKHIFIHWVGPRVGNVRRGLWNACGQLATKQISAHCPITCRREAHSSEDLRLDGLISELLRVTRVDGVAAKDGVAAGRITEAEYLAFLCEEVFEQDRMLQVSGQHLEPERAPLPELNSAIEMVRDTGDLNWVLIGCRRSRRSVPPSSAHGGC